MSTNEENSESAKVYIEDVWDAVDTERREKSRDENITIC